MRIRRTLLSLPGILTLATGSLLLLSGAGPASIRARARAQYANFVRPGLIIKVTGAEIAADGTIRAHGPAHGSERRRRSTARA